MKTIAKFLQLSWRERWLLLKSWLLLATLRIALRFLPLQKLLRTAEWAGKPQSRLQGSRRESVDKITWAVRVAARRVPEASCLTQALASLILLGRRGHAAQLRVGVLRPAADTLQAHAWVEINDQVVIGGSSDLSSFAQFPRMTERV